MSKKWPMRTLGEVAKWGSGGTPKRTTPAFFGGDIPWLVIGDLTDGPVTNASTYITEEGLKKSSAKWVEPGAVLLAMYGSIGKLGIAQRRLTTNQAIAFAYPHEGQVTNRFLFWFLRSVRNDLFELGKGGTQRNISQTVIKQVLMPVPPIDEQQAIVEEIEKQFTRLDAAVASLRRIQSSLKRYRVGVLEGTFAAFSDHGISLSEVAEVRLGRQRSPKNRASKFPRPYLRAANVTWRGLDLSDVKTMDFKPSEFETYKLKLGDVLLSEASGSASEAGKPALWSGEIDGCCFQNTLIRVRSRGPLPEYLRYHFLRDALGGRFAAASRGVGIHHIGANTLSNWEVYVPSLKEQAQVIATLDTKLSVLDQLEKDVAPILKRGEQLRESILARAFSGQLIRTEEQ